MQAPQHIVLENTTGKEAIDTKQQNNNDTEVMKQSGAILPVRHGNEGFVISDLSWTSWLGLTAMVAAYGSYGVLINLSKENGIIPFSSTSLVLMIEGLKLTVSLSIYVSSKKKDPKWMWPSFQKALPFSVPGILYSINNNLSVLMQAHMDPATYQVLGNLKIVTTAVLYRILLQRQLKIKQWVSVGLLTVAGVCDSWFSLSDNTVKKSSELHLHVTLTGLVLMLIYCFISAFAGVYTEYILKKDLNTSLHLQNIMLYIVTVAINLFTWLTSKIVAYYSDADNAHFHLLEGFSIYTWLIILTQVFNGLAMSAVMKHGNNLVRLFVISCAMLFSTALSVLVLGLTLHGFFFITLVLVIFAIYIYYN